MPLLSVIRFFTTLLSLALLAAAGYLLWSWSQGEWVDVDGTAMLVRDDWRLWIGLALLAWSFLGRSVMVRVLARPDTRKTHVVHADGQALAGASGSTLHVETAGSPDGPPIVFTHGWGLDSTVWTYARQDLGDRFRLVLWDLPGLGKSKLPQHGDVALENFAADLGTVLASAGRQPAVLVGHSIGGMTIQTLVRDHPELSDRIAGVVLLNTTYTNPLKTIVLSKLAQALRRPVLEPMMKLMILLQPIVWLSQWQSYLSGSAHLAHRFGFGKYVTRSQLEQSALLATRNAPGVQMKGNLAMFRWDATGALARFHKPVLVVGGDVDIITKLEASEAITAQAGSARLQTVHDVNHMGFLERADLYNQLIADFSLSVQPSATRDARSFAPADLEPREIDAIFPERRPPAAPLH